MDCRQCWDALVYTLFLFTTIIRFTSLLLISFVHMTTSPITMNAISLNLFVQLYYTFIVFTFPKCFRRWSFYQCRVFFCLILMATSFHAATKIQSSKANSLLKWKPSLDNNSKALLSSWTGNYPCRWEGITCDDECKNLTNLKISNNNLSGSISLELGGATKALREKFQRT
jgi:magnesium-transporting ATPase (P-type)